MKIGVFDSGVGGITVLHQLQKTFPKDTFCYFGDTANVPYGSKSISMIQYLCHSAANRMRDHQINALVVACNTASSLALNEIRLALPNIPVLGMVEAGVQAIIDGISQATSSQEMGSSQKNNVLILGTRATIQSRIYSKTLSEQSLTIRVLEQACPLLVPMIEEGWTQHPILVQTVEWYLRPYLDHPPGVILLGCTHYPWIREVFEKVLPQWTVLDAAKSAAQLLRAQISERVLESTPPAVSVQWFFSDPDALSPHIRDTEHIQDPKRF